MSDLLPIGLSYGVTNVVYRADLGLNQSLLKAFGSARTPAHFKYEQEQPREETPELRIGSYVDVGITNEPLWEFKFAIWPGERRG